jgi:hypothetical protein
MTTPKIFNHKGRALKLSAYDAPQKPAKKPTSRRAPGAGQFEISQLTLAENTLTAQINGKNIAYLFVEILMKDGENFYGPVLREYIPADSDNETGGILRPNWSDPISLSIPLRPSLTLLTDGVDSAFAFCIPTGYRVSGSHLDGQYTSAAEGSQSRARIVFDGDGKIKEILAFKQQRMKSIPRPVTPKPGDTFAPFVQVLTEEDGASLRESETALSTPLTFGEQPFHLEKESLLPGEYLAGILVQDLDGKFTRKYVPLKI